MKSHEQHAEQIADLQQWRSKLVSWIMKGVILAAFFVGIPNAVLALKNGHLVLAVTHTLALVWVSFLYHYRARNPQRVTRWLLVGLYLFGVITMVSEDYLALIYLIVLPTAAAMLVSRRATVGWLVVTTTTVFSCGLFLNLQPQGVSESLFFSWLLIALNFSVVSAALAVACEFLLSGLDMALNQQRQDAEKLQHLAMHDNLTGLGNRRLFNDRIEQTIAKAQRQPRSFALLLMDLDHFKNINDSHGHHVGDQLIKAVAERLETMLRAGDTAARLGGDEYVLLLDPVDSDADLTAAVTRVLAGIKGAYSCGGNKLFVSASVGIAVYPRDGQTVDALLKNADAAMYQAKDAGRNRHQFFQAEMSVRLLERLKTEEDFRDALARQELRLYFQPRVRSNCGTCVSAEALIRWQHPTRGLLLPDQFIAVAESSGLIVPMGAWVLRAATEQLVLWQAKYPQLRLSVNVSAREFQDGALLERIRQANDRLPPHSLELEITESLIIDNLTGVQQLLAEVRKHGVSVALDDFGTGLSSLSYLRTLPLDIIKIDRSFVSDLAVDPQNHAIVKTIVDLANNLQLSTVAEGVETAAQAQVLRSLGVDELQGYLFARPMPADVFETWLEGSQKTLL
jgi:diguanylate cyclase (GGDEF)-like protein